MGERIQRKEEAYYSIMAARKPTPAGWRPATSGAERAAVQGRG